MEDMKCVETVYHSQGNWGSRYGCANKRGLRKDVDGKMRCAVHNLAAAKRRRDAKLRRRDERKHCPTCTCKDRS